MYKKCIKRLLDILLSLTGIVVLSPLYVILWILIRCKLGKPAIFTQDRPGKNEKVFRLYKFRSMTDERDADGNLLPDEKRLTHFGKILRTTSLDELPELFNILVGQMALVGPRPLLTAYLPLYSEEQHHRHDVRPGLTGYAQVHGRNAVPWEERFRMDVWYTQNITFRLDCRILLDTVRVVFRHDGIGSGTSETMEPFAGNRTAAVEVGAEKEESAQWAQGKD